MDDYIMEHFYGDRIKVRLFVYDHSATDFSTPREVVKQLKLVPTEVPSGHLIEQFIPGEVYHVPLTNSIYFDPNFTDFDIVGTVQGSEGLEVYCDFYAAFDPDTVLEMLQDSGWNYEPLVEPYRML